MTQIHVPRAMEVVICVGNFYVNVLLMKRSDHTYSLLNATQKCLWMKYPWRVSVLRISADEFYSYINLYSAPSR